MSIGSTTTGKFTLHTQAGGFRAVDQIAITGLTAASANTIPHNLPFTPSIVIMAPGANGLWGQTQAPDATNIYITVGTGGATAGTVWVIA